MIDNYLLDYLRKISPQLTEQARAGDQLSRRLLEQYNLFFRAELTDHGWLLERLTEEWHQREIMRGHPDNPERNP